MTKEIKRILNKDLKKYRSVAEVASEENKEIFEEVVEFFEEMLEK